jgi:hypothetical protein
MIKLKDGKGKNKGVFFGSWDDKRVQWIFLQLRAGADNRDIGLYARLTQHQSNPSMGVKPKSKRVLVQAFPYKYHALLLPAFMPFKAH